MNLNEKADELLQNVTYVSGLHQPLGDICVQLVKQGFMEYAIAVNVATKIVIQHAVKMEVEQQVIELQKEKTK